MLVLLLTVFADTVHAIEAGSGVRTFGYDDAHDRRTETSPRGTATTRQFDRMGRLLSETTPAGTRSLHYDGNGNPLDETDVAGHVTSYAYDAANRMQARHEPENRTTLFAYDALGQVTRETVGEGEEASGDPRVTEYVYAHPAYRRTDVRKHLSDSNGDTWAVEHTGYDGNGNVAHQIASQLKTICRLSSR